VGTGFSSFSVSEGRVYTSGFAGGQDTIFCFDAETGKVIWKHSYEELLGDKYYEGGTSATPTVDGAVVYTLSKRGKVFCLEAATGKVRWSKKLVEDYGMAIPEWGFASSALVQGDLVVFNVGTAGLALKKQDGSLAWQNGKDAPGYATPVPFVEGGKTRLAILGSKVLQAVDADTGKPAWQYPWKTMYDVNAADPIIAGNQVFISSSYGKGCGLVTFANGQVTKVYENKYMKNHFNSCVLLDGRLYGTTGEAGQSGCYLVCMDFKTGMLLWQEKSVGLGALMAADGKLIVQGDHGELLVVKAQGERFEALSRAKVLSGKCWTTPVLSQGHIYCRNAAGAVVCLEVKP
jgi:outer membrane protein assembly factor BamB